MDDVKPLTEPFLPSCVFAAWVRLDGGCGERHDIELPEMISRAIPRRQGSYRGGRACADHALRQLGFSFNQPIWPKMGDDRAPIWPGEVIGSISHSDDIALAVVAMRNDIDGVGVDVERPIAKDEAASLARQVCQPFELKILQPTRWNGHEFTAIFSGKEALYKAIYPTVRRFVDFDEAHLVRMENDVLTFSFSTSLRNELGRPTINVRLHEWQGHILTIAVLHCKNYAIPF